MDSFKRLVAVLILCVALVGVCAQNAAAGVAPTIFTWNTPAAGNWSDGTRWTNDQASGSAPVAAGQVDYRIVFNQAGSYVATNDANAGFLLNQLTLGGSTVTLAGNGLAFSANGGTLPQIFQNSASAVTITAPIALASNVTMGGSGNGEVSLRGVLSGAGDLITNGAGRITLYAANTRTGSTVINAGELYIRGLEGALLGAGSLNVTVNSGGTLSGDRSNFIGTLTLNGGTWSEYNGFGGSWTGPLTLSATSTLSSSFSQSVAGVVSGPGGLIVVGNGTRSFTDANTFNGAVIVRGGVVSVASLNRVVGGTAASGLGVPTNATTGAIALGATSVAGALEYTGPGETTDRVISLTGTTGGAVIAQSGTGSGISTTRGTSGELKFTSAVSIPGTPGVDNRKTLTLTQTSSPKTGSTPGRGEISGSIRDSAQGAVGQLATSVTKAGVGIWTLSGANTYTGATRVQAGTLIISGATALGSGALDISTGALVQLDFVGTRQIAALTLAGGAPLANGTYGSSASLATTQDDVHFSGLGTVTVGPIAAATTTTLARTSGSNPATGGAMLTFTATVTGAAATGNVIFYDGLTVMGTSPLNGSFQASLATGALTAGVHAITALYERNGSNATSSSTALAQTVVETRSATTTTLVSGVNPSGFTAAATFVATVTGAAPGGAVTIFDGSAALGSAILSGTTATFSLTSLSAGWHPITACYVGDANNQSSSSTPPVFQTVNPAAGNGKVKVFILAGQSNMVGHSFVETGRDPNNLSVTNLPGGLGSLRHMLNANPDRYGYLADPAHPIAGGSPGWLTCSDVWVSYWGESNVENRRGILDADFGDNGGLGRIGPEYGFGLVVGSRLADQVLLVKYAFGGKSLKVDFRPPSSGGTVGPYYTGMITRTRQVLDNLSTFFPAYTGGGYELAGFGWHQGWNDIGETTAEYEGNLVNLINDVRAEFGVPNLPVAIGGTGMANGYGSNVLVAQLNVGNPALHPEFAGTVASIDTRPFDYGEMRSPSADATHWNWNAESYFNVGESMGLAMARMLPTPAAPPPAASAAPATPTANQKKCGLVLRQSNNVG